VERNNTNTAFRNSSLIARNTLLLYLRILCMLPISLYVSRSVLQTLGVDDYGIYSVVASFVGIFSFFETTLYNCLQRFFNTEIGRHSEEGAQRVYTTGVGLIVILSLLIMLVLGIGGYFYQRNILVVAADRHSVAAVVLALVAGVALMRILQVPFMSMIIAYEKMGYYVGISLADILLQLIIAIILPHTTGDRLVNYAIMMAILGLIDFFIYRWICKKKFAAARQNICSYRPDFELMKTMIKFSAWSFLGAFSSQLKLQGQNIIINTFVGPVINAARSLAVQISSAVASTYGAINRALAPQEISSYSAGEFEHTIRLMFGESKLSFLIASMLAIPLALEIDNVLQLWLGANVPPYTGTIATLALIDVLITTFNPPCTKVVQATGRIRNYEIGCAVANLLLLPSAWLALYCGCPVISVFVCSNVFSLINQTLCIYFSNKEFAFGIGRYLKYVAGPCVFLSICLVIPIFAITRWLDPSIGRLVLSCSVSLVISALYAYLIMFGPRESKNYILTIARVLGQT